MASLNFTRSQDKELVKQVKQHRVLYDSSCALYKQVGVRYKIWTDIATKIDKSAEECKLRWKNIRDSYNRYKRRCQADVTRDFKSHKLCKWKFFEHLAFLDDLTAETDAKPAEPAEEKPDEWSSEDSEEPSQTVYEQNDDIDVKVNIVNPLAGASPRKENTTTTFERDKMIVVDASFDADERTSNSDDDHTFSMHVKSVLKKISPRLKILAKNEIFATLSKYETMNLDLLEQRGSTSTEYNYR